MKRLLSFGLTLVAANAAHAQDRREAADPDSRLALMSETFREICFAPSDNWRARVQAIETRPSFELQPKDDEGDREDELDHSTIVDLDYLDWENHLWVAISQLEDFREVCMAQAEVGQTVTLDDLATALRDDLPLLENLPVQAENDEIRYSVPMEQGTAEVSLNLDRSDATFPVAQITIISNAKAD